MSSMKIKTSTSKTSQSGSILTRLRPDTPAKKLLAFVLLFAVIGGSYLAYRSFAATPAVKTYYADAFTAEARSTKSSARSGGSTYSVIDLVGPDTNNRARITARTKEKYAGPQKICFEYKVGKKNGKPAKARTAFAVYSATNTSTPLDAVSVLSSSSDDYKQKCLEFDAGGSKTLVLALSVWDGTARFTKSTIQKSYTFNIKAADFSKYTSRMTDVRTIKQSGGSKDGETVAEMHKPNSQLLFWLNGEALNEKIKISRNKKYEACITYSIGDRGSASDLVSYYPIGKTKVDQQNHNTTKSLSTYKTECHTFTYVDGNADAVSLHYPNWAQSLSSPYKIRIASLKISQK